MLKIIKKETSYFCYIYKMGRLKKYATEEERKAAQREQARRYNKEKYQVILREKRKKTKEEHAKIIKLYEDGKLYDENGEKISL